MNTVWDLMPSDQTDQSDQFEPLAPVTQIVLIELVDEGAADRPPRWRHTYESGEIEYRDSAYMRDPTPEAAPAMVAGAGAPAAIRITGGMGIAAAAFGTVQTGYTGLDRL